MQQTLLPTNHALEMSATGIDSSITTKVAEDRQLWGATEVVHL